MNIVPDIEKNIKAIELNRIYSNAFVNGTLRLFKSLKQGDIESQKPLYKKLKKLFSLGYGISTNHKRVIELKSLGLLSSIVPFNQVLVIKDERLSNLLSGSQEGFFTPLEQAIHNVCNKFNIIFTITSTDKEKECARLLYHEITTTGIDECVLNAISVTKHVQNCNYDINISEEECILAYNILTEEKGCNLSFQQYQSLLNKGFTPYTISTIYSEGYTLSPDGKSLKTLVNVYPLDLINFSSVSLTGVGDRHAFLEEALKYINIPYTDKVEILNS